MLVLININDARPDIVLMAITSHMSGCPRIGEVVVAGWQIAGLLKASTIKPIVTTIEKRLVIRKLGHLEEHDTLALKDALKIVLG